jgi:hypothetical protein
MKPKNHISQVLIRIDGFRGENVPEGFKRPCESYPQMIVYEFPQAPCEFKKGLVHIERQLKKMTGTLQPFLRNKRCCLALNFLIEDADEGCIQFLQFPHKYLELFSKFHLDIEIQI